MMTSNNFIVVFLNILWITIVCPQTNQLKLSRKVQQIPREIDDHKLKIMNDVGDMGDFNKHLDQILIPRVVGTPGHDNVKEYIKQTMTDLHWTVETDKFKDNAPIFGQLSFENIIATLNPKADRFLVLACHYDSKYFPKAVFLGATDSAVPCSMMLNLAKVIGSYLDQNRMSNVNVSMKFIFFDGEEAFQEWTATDSIYGARHLAAKWEKENFLEKIDMFVLLDLLGASDPQFFSFFRSTDEWYMHLSNIETRFIHAGILSHYTFSGVGETLHSHGPNLYFQARSLNGGIEDDHIPFMRRGVPILHLIPLPFPDVWHKIGDNRDIVDMQTVENLNRIFRVLVIEYLHLDV